LAASQYGESRRRLATIPGKTSMTVSISDSVLKRLRLKRTEPWTAENGTFIARRTCEGSSEPEVQAEPEEAQMP